MKISRPAAPSSDLAALLVRAESVLARLEQVLPAPAAPVDWKESIAFRWRRKGERVALEPIHQVHHIDLRDLHGIDDQKKQVEQNTRQFVEGLPANNVL
ncbi:MAG: hypothetical protein RJA24_64, partial [Pseudomonadota bacterium]